METVVAGDRVYYVARDNANSDMFMISVNQLSEAGICVSYGFEELFNEQCDIAIRKPGTYSISLSDAFEEHLHIMIHSSSDSLQTVDFTVYYMHQMQNNTVREQKFEAYVPQYFVF